MVSGLMSMGADGSSLSAANDHPGPKYSSGENFVARVRNVRPRETTKIASRSVFLVLSNSAISTKERPCSAIALPAASPTKIDNASNGSLVTGLFSTIISFLVSYPAVAEHGTIFVDRTTL